MPFSRIWIRFSLESLFFVAFWFVHGPVHGGFSLKRSTGRVPRSGTQDFKGGNMGQFAGSDPCKNPVASISVTHLFFRTDVQQKSALAKYPFGHRTVTSAASFLKQWSQWSSQNQRMMMMTRRRSAVWVPASAWTKQTWGSRPAVQSVSGGLVLGNR